MLQTSATAAVTAEPAHCVLMLIRLPSFNDPESLSITRVRDKNPLCLSHTRWDRTADMAKLDSPVERMRWPRHLEPTIISTENGLDASLAESIRRELSGIQTSVHPETTSIGLDGTGYELRWTHEFTRASFRWWEEGPSEWQELANWFDRSWSRLSDAIANL